VVVPNDLDQAAFRLSKLQRSRAADATLKNLLATLSSQIQTCSNLAVFAYEAETEGHQALAGAFRDLAQVEQASFTTLLDCLRRHLNELPQNPPTAAVRGTRAEAANR